MKSYHPYAFPPLRRAPGEAAQLDGLPAAPQILSSDESFEQGWQAGHQAGYEAGYESGRVEGRNAGFELGRTEGAKQGFEEGRREARVTFEAAVRPVDAMLAELQAIQADYQAALRNEVVELVAEVARQVIRRELELKPVQLLAMVDEALSGMPSVPDHIEVHLNPDDCRHLKELAPERAALWKLVADTRLEPGECRLKIKIGASEREVDLGCKQRLDACIERVHTQLNNAAHHGSDEVSNDSRHAA